MIGVIVKRWRKDVIFSEFDDTISNKNEDRGANNRSTTRLGKMRQKLYLKNVYSRPCNVLNFEDRLWKMKYEVLHERTSVFALSIARTSEFIRLVN
jgi:hypothetical protein